jgi:hypothetical protein
MFKTCECGLLHIEPTVRSGCQECGTACCPSCAVHIASHTYCRWCATGLALAVHA